MVRFINKHLGAIVGVLVSIVGWAFAMGVSYTNLDTRLGVTESRIVDGVGRTEYMHQLQDREIGDLKRRVGVSEMVYNEMARKLDVAIAVLERIERKMDKVDLK